MHFENFNFKLTIPGDKDAPKRKKGTDPYLPKNINHANMEQWLQQSGLDDDTKNALIKKIKTYPSNTLVHFYENLHTHIAQVREKLRKKD